MFNILVATRVWAESWKNKKLTIFCDNEAVLYVLNTGRTKHELLAAISRNIFMNCAQHDISLIFRHIQGKNNSTADLLSRWTNSVKDVEKLKNLAPNVNWRAINDNHTFLDMSI